MNNAIHTLLNRIKNRVENGQIAILALDIVVAILMVILVSRIISAADNIHSDLTNYTFSEDSFIWNMEDEEYGSLMSMYRENRNAGKSTKKLKDYEYVGKYAQDTFFYRIFELQNDTEMTDLYQQMREEDSAGMGDYGFQKDLIDKKIGIQ